MTTYANTTERKPRALPSRWRNIDGLDRLTDAQLATLGWYPVRYETLQTGASGYADFPAEPTNGEWIVESLPADPARVLREAWAKDATRRARTTAQKTLAQPLSDSPTGNEIAAREAALLTLLGV